MIRNFSFYSSKIAFYFTIVVLFILFLNLLRTTSISLEPLFNGDYKNLSYSTWAISEWLINYEGGFVRRGLFGELLLLAYKIHSYDVKFTILIINSFFFFWCAYLTYGTCHKLNTSTIPVLVVFCGAMLPFNQYRRDFLILTLTFYVFKLYFDYLKTKEHKYLFSFILLMSLCILIHEASFFFSIPILTCLFWFSINDKLFSKNKLIQCCKIFSIPVLIMALTCFMKGSESVAQDIWKSWTPIFHSYPEDNAFPVMGSGVAFLQREFLPTAGFHLEVNYYIWGYPFVTSFMYIFSVFCSLVATYFLLTFSPEISFYKRAVNLKKKICLGKILLTQYFFMLPMFTILSCDFGRTILYCVISSLFFYYFLEKTRIQIYIPRLFSQFSCYDHTQDSNVSQRLIWLYLVIVILFPIRAYSGIIIPDDCYLNKFIHFCSELFT